MNISFKRARVQSYMLSQIEKVFLSCRGNFFFGEKMRGNVHNQFVLKIVSRVWKICVIANWQFYFHLFAKVAVFEIFRSPRNSVREQYLFMLLVFGGVKSKALSFD